MKENVRRHWRTHLCCGRLRLVESSGGDLNASAASLIPLAMILRISGRGHMISSRVKVSRACLCRVEWNSQPPEHACCGFRLLLASSLPLTELFRHQRRHQQRWYVHVLPPGVICTQTLLCTCAASSQVRCLRTAEYPTAAATTSSSTRSTETWPRDTKILSSSSF